MKQCQTPWFKRCEKLIYMYISNCFVKKNPNKNPVTKPTPQTVAPRMQHSVRLGCSQWLGDLPADEHQPSRRRGHCPGRGRSPSSPAGPRPCVRRGRRRERGPGGQGALVARQGRVWPPQRSGPAPAGPSSSFLLLLLQGAEEEAEAGGISPRFCRKPRLYPAPAVPRAAGTAPGPAQAPRPAAMAARPALTHDLHPANGAGVALHVPAPHGHRIPLLQREHLVGGARLGARGTRQRVGGAGLVPVLHIGHGGGAGTRRPRRRQRHPPAAAAQPRPRRGEPDGPGGGDNAGEAPRARRPCCETECVYRALKRFLCVSRTLGRCRAGIAREGCFHTQSASESIITPPMVWPALSMGRQPSLPILNTFPETANRISCATFPIGIC